MAHKNEPAELLPGLVPPSSTAGQPPTDTKNIDLVNQFKSGFSDVPYANSPAFQSIISGFAAEPGRTLINGDNIAQWQQLLKGYGNTFATQFKNLTGRDPTANEYNTFFEQVVAPEQPWNRTPSQLEVQQGATNLLNTAFSGTIEQAKQQQAQQQAEAALAPGSAFDTWQNSYNKSVSDLEGQLADYHSRLMEKIRPQLLISLQSQGLLNSGALNEAFAGASKDLANESQNIVANARLAAGSDIANKRFAIASAPTNFALNNTFNSIPNLTSAGQGALNNVWQNIMNQNYMDQQMRIKQMELDNQPSALSKYTGMIVGGVAGGLPGAFSNYFAMRGR